MRHFLEASLYSSDEAALIGRDPRSIPANDWEGRPYVVGLAAIRAKCLDCAHTQSEVRKCVCVDCPLWTLRMGSVPKGYRFAAQEASYAEGRSPAGVGPENPTCSEIGAMRAKA